MLCSLLEIFVEFDMAHVMSIRGFGGKFKDEDLRVLTNNLEAIYEMLGDEMGE